ncbi:MAG: glycoside hydrolase family 3 N-terminal domain-containing protein [Microthrixaceae bacterium]
MHPLQRTPLVRAPATLLVVLTFALLAACTGTSRSQVEVQAPTTNPKAPSTTRVADCAEVLPASAQAGQLLMVMVTAPGLAKEAIDTGTAGGFGLKGRQSKDVGAQIKDTVAAAPIKAFVASDEEGGSVQRFELALGKLPSAATLAKGTPEEAATIIGDYSKKMVELGVDMNFAPVADVGSGSDLGTRSFGDDPVEVSRFVTASIKAQQEAGLIPVVKHWPGIGGGKTDPHDSLDVIASLAELAQKDLVPFNAAFQAGVPAVMVAHAEVPGLTQMDEPASLSPAAITEQLKGKDKFAGLVITDSLGMGAVIDKFSQDEAAEKAILAGADIALLSGADVVPVAHERLTDAITTGRISQARVIDAVRKVLSTKGITGECPDLVASIASAQQGLSKPGDTNTTTGSDSQTSSGSTDSSGSGSGTGSGSGSDSSGSGSGQRDTGINDTP